MAISMEERWEKLRAEVLEENNRFQMQGVEEFSVLLEAIRNGQGVIENTPALSDSQKDAISEIVDTYKPERITDIRDVEGFKNLVDERREAYGQALDEGALDGNLTGLKTKLQSSVDRVESQLKKLGVEVDDWSQEKIDNYLARNTTTMTDEKTRMKYSLLYEREKEKEFIGRINARQAELSKQEEVAVTPQPAQEKPGEEKAPATGEPGEQQSKLMAGIVNAVTDPENLKTAGVVALNAVVPGAALATGVAQLSSSHPTMQEAMETIKNGANVALTSLSVATYDEAVKEAVEKGDAQAAFAALERNDDFMKAVAQLKGNASYTVQSGDGNSQIGAQQNVGAEEGQKIVNHRAQEAEQQNLPG